MSIIRVATYPQVRYSTGQNMRLNAQYAGTSNQIASGLKSQNWGGLAKEANAVTKLEADLKQTESYITGLQAAQSEVTAMYNVVSNMIKEIDEIMADISAAISGSLLQPGELQATAEALYDAVIFSLNTQYQDRYLFAGANTGNAPVDVNDPDYLLVSPFAAGDPANTDYYQGDNTVQSVQAGDGYRIDYGINANESAFEEILRGLSMLIALPGDKPTQDASLDLLISASDQLVSIQHALSVDATKIEAQIDVHETTVTELENTIANIKEVDLARASTELAATETQLEASFSATGRLLSLSILDFLR
jgi:flagellar hook-associated protein 3 FlgL